MYLLRECFLFSLQSVVFYLFANYESKLQNSLKTRERGFFIYFQQDDNLLIKNGDCSIWLLSHVQYRVSTK